MSLRDLLDAERALGRLTEALSRAEARALWRGDALRREALAAAELDGRRVDWENLVVAQLDPTLLSQELRPTTVAPLRLIATAEALERGIGLPNTGQASAPELRLPHSPNAPKEGEAPGRTESFPLPPPPPSTPAKMDITAVLAAARRSAADIDAFIAHPAPEEAESEASPALPRFATPLSADWLAAAWCRYSLDPASLPCPETVADLLEDALGQPGLAGVAAALHSLERRAPFPAPPPRDYSGTDLEPDIASKLTQARAANQPTDPKFAFIRLLAPWLIQRACGLSEPAPWLSPALLPVRSGYAAARDSSGPAWDVWLYPALTAGFIAERRRLANLHMLLDRCQARFSAEKRRWASNREMLMVLINRPAVTTRFLGHERGISRRGAQMLVAELRDAGIVRHVFHGKGRDWWLADQVR